MEGEATNQPAGSRDNAKTNRSAVDKERLTTQSQARGMLGYNPTIRNTSAVPRLKSDWGVRLGLLCGGEVKLLFSVST